MLITIEQLCSPTEARQAEGYQEVCLLISFYRVKPIRFLNHNVNVI